MNIRLAQRAAALVPSATLAVTEKARALKARGVDVIAFAAGQPDFDTPAFIKQAAISALERGDTKYPTPAVGIPALRDAVCAYFRQFCGLDYAPNAVCVNVGAKDTLYLAFQALIDPGDEVIVPVPYWVSYPEQVRLAGGTPVFVEPDANLKMTPAALAAALTPRTRAVIINSPSNPSGVAYSADELAALAEVIAGSDALVIADEIYHRLYFGQQAPVALASLPGMFARTLSVNGCSKTYAMTGWRLGFAGGPQPLIKAIGQLQGQATSGPTSFVQTACVDALTGDQTCVDEMRAAYRRRVETMVAGLRAIDGVDCPMPDGTFYVFPDVSGTFARLGVSDADGFAERALDQAHVAMVSGVAFGMPKRVRLSFATSDQQIETGLARLTKMLS